jgi:hypothetical protein
MIQPKWNLQTHIAQSANYMFEPTINIFDKSVVVCYQKVGTRFFLFLSNYPKTLSQTYNQYQINLSYYKSVDGRLELNTLFGDFGSSINFIKEHENSCYNYDTFFEKNGVNDMNGFMLNNPKDMYFVIRDPISRFLSGITQISAPYVSELITQPEERSRIKSLSDITDNEIDSIYNNYNHYFNAEDSFSEQNLSYVDMNILIKIILYIIKYKPNLYFYDAHTQNYLGHYKELIANISDKSKVKIIDLADCKKESAYTLFNTWSDTIDYTSVSTQTSGHVVSNKKLYNHIISKLNDDDDAISQSLYYFLSSEYKEYNQLKNSKYFINL